MYGCTVVKTIRNTHQSLSSIFVPFSASKYVSKLLYDCCMDFSKYMPLTSSLSPRFLCPKSAQKLCWSCCMIFLENCASSLEKCANLLLYGFLPWEPCLFVVVRICWSLYQLPSFSSLLRNFSFAFSPPLSICSWKNEWPFSSFNLTLSDFWEIPKSNGWDSFKSTAGD